MPSEYAGSAVKTMSNKDFQIKTSKNGKESLYLKNQKDLHKVGLVKFFAPWCGHCVNMVPTLKKIAQSNNNSNNSNNVMIGSVDCTSSKGNKQLADKINIEGFPTIFSIRPSGRLKPYTKGRDEQSINTHIKKQLNKMN